jgi:IPT/TIG domain
LLKEGRKEMAGFKTLRGGVVAASGAISLLLLTASVAWGAPSVTITQFSPAVSGNIGTPTSGVGVEVSLRRVDQVVDSATTTTEATGDWTATLPTHAPSSDREDTLTVAYSGAGAPANATYERSLVNSGYAYIAPDGSEILIAGVYGFDNTPAAIPVTVHYASSDTTEEFEATPESYGIYRATFPTDVTAADTVTVEASGEVETGSNVSDLSVVYTTGLPGVGPGLKLEGGGSSFRGAEVPRCSADLVDARVTCDELLAGSKYTVEQTRGGSPVAAQTLTAVESSESERFGLSESEVSGVFPGLQAGDEVNLIVPAEGANPARTVTTLHAAPLRADVIEENDHLVAPGTSGSCQPGEFIYESGGFPVCSSLGTFSLGSAEHEVRTEDDSSGGSTSVSVPAFLGESPTDNELVQSSFTAYAEVTNYGILDTTSPVSLSLTPALGGATQMFAGNANSPSGVYVSGLSPGAYSAVWTVTDAHGDTASLTTWVVVESPPPTTPAVTKVSPKKGAASGGTHVTITGSGFAGVTEVKFGSAKATEVEVNPSGTAITATSPAGAGIVYVTVTGPNGTSPIVIKKGKFKYKRVKVKK